MESLRLYIKESVDELVNNVTWPTWSELIQSTGLVLIASAIFAIVIFIMDSVSNFGLGLIYQ
jgi:preprotein translocase subunit SecE